MKNLFTVFVSVIFGFLVGVAPNLFSVPTKPVEYGFDDCVHDIVSAIGNEIPAPHLSTVSFRILKAYAEQECYISRNNFDKAVERTLGHLKVTRSEE